MKFGTEKYANMLIMKKDGKETIEGIELPNQGRVRTFGGGKEENYTQLGILEADTIKQIEIKVNIKTEYLRRTRKFIEIKFRSKNLIKRINTWAIFFEIHLPAFLKWTRKEHIYDHETRKLIYKDFRLMYDIDSLRVPRKEGRKASNENCVKVTI